MAEQSPSPQSPNTPVSSLHPQGQLMSNIKFTCCLAFLCPEIQHAHRLWGFSCEHWEAIILPTTLASLSSFVKWDSSTVPSKDSAEAQRRVLSTEPGVQ